MPEKATAPTPRKGLLLRLLRWLSWVLIVVALVGVALYLSFGPVHLVDRLKPAAPAFPEHVTADPTPAAAAAQVPAPVSAPQESRELVKLMLDSIEDIWGEFLARADYAYKKPRLELYEGRIEAPCKLSGSFSGAFYCPTEMRLYIDLAYLDELQKRAPQVGDLARSYVVAHTAAHHVQNLLGVVGWFKEYHTDGNRSNGAKNLQEAQELIADCLVGSWLRYAQRKYAWLKPEDMEEALKAVIAQGEERAKTQGQPSIVDPLTLGGSEIRMRWLQLGMETGDPRECSQLITGEEQ